MPGRWPPRHPPEVKVAPGRPKGNSASFRESFQQSSSSAVPGIAREGHKQLQPKVTKDERRGGTRGAAPAPSPAPAARGQRISRDEAQGSRRSCSRDGFAFPVTPTQQGDIWGRVCSHRSCCNPLPVLNTGPRWPKLAARAGITISSWQCPGNVWTDTHRAGRGGVPKGTSWYGAGGVGPAGHGAAKGTGTVTAREGTPRCHRPFLQGTDLPRSTAGHRALPPALPETGNPAGSPAPPKQLPRNSAHSSAPGRDREQQRRWGAASRDQESPLSVPSAAGCGALPGTTSSTPRTKPPHNPAKRSRRDCRLLGEGLSPPETSPEAGGAGDVLQGGGRAGAAGGGPGSSACSRSTGAVHGASGELSSAGQPTWRGEREKGARSGQQEQPQLGSSCSQRVQGTPLPGNLPEILLRSHSRGG